jgi:4-amino-4-deoxy-L-arabinose transferase-like glycosyltransferase
MRPPTPPDGQPPRVGATEERDRPGAGATLARPRAGARVEPGRAGAGARLEPGRVRPGWLALIVLLALGIRLLLFGGLLGWDDVQYAEEARAVREGGWPLSMFGLRLGLVLPLAATQAIVGPGEHAAALVPLGYAVAEIVLACMIGALLGGPALGLGAAALLAVLPLHVVAATDLHADLPAAVFMAATMYAVLRAEREPLRWRAWSTVAGLTFGAAFLSKEAALALAAVLVLRVVIGQGARRTLGAMAPGFAALVGLEALALWWATGNPLHRFSAGLARPHAEHMLRMAPSLDWMASYGAMLLHPASPYLGYFAAIVYLAGAGVLWGIRRGDRATREALGWWAPLLIVLNFAPLAPDFSRPLFVHFPRTLHPLLVPLAVGAAAWLVAGLRRRRAARALVVGGVAALAALGTWTTHQDHRAWAAVARQAAPLIDGQPAGTIVAADHVNAWLLRWLLPERRGEIVWYADARAPAPAPTLVLRDPLLLESDVRHGHAVPAAVRTPPAAWDVVARFDRPRRASVRGLIRDWLSGRSEPSPPPEPALLLKVGAGAGPPGARATTWPGAG